MTIPGRGITRRALLGAAAAVGLGSGVAVYLRLAHGLSAEGIEVHARPRELPALRFTDERGAPTSLSAFRGRVVLLNLWATWCGPCREEMLTLDRLQGSLGGADFEVVPLSIDSGGLPVVQAFFRSIGVKHLHAYLDTDHEAAELVMTGVPLTLLIDRESREVARKIGPAKWDDPKVVALIRRYMPSGAGGAP
jgi:thiol-disulfide isomerase/thioredoxin